MGSIAAFLQLAQLILGLFPMIFEAVKAVEAAIPGSGNGKAKFDAVMATIEGVYKSLTDTTLPAFERMVPALCTAINSAVTAYNATGWGKPISVPGGAAAPTPK